MRTTSQFAAALAIALVACGPSGTDPAPTTQSSEPVAPVSRPASVAATLIIDDVTRFHDDLKTRHGLGAYLLGKSWAGTVASLSGLPIATAEHIDLGGRIRGVITTGTKDAGFAVAIPLHNPGALLAVATAGDASPFRRRAEGAWDHLVPVRDEGSTVARALISNHLVIASSPAVLAEVGAFLAQAAPSGFPGSEEPALVSATSTSGAGRHESNVRGRIHVATAKPVLAALAARLGAEVPFDLGAFVPARFGEEVPFRITAGPSSVSATLELGAAIDKASAPLEVGPTAKLFELPAESQLGLVLYQPEHARASSARTGSSWLGSGPLAGGGALLTQAFEDVAHARGPGLSIGYQRAGTGPMMFGVADIADEARVRSGLESFVKSLEDKGIESALGARGIAVSASTTVLERVGEVTRVGVSRNGERSALILLRIEKGRLYLAAGADAAAGLASVTTEGPRLGSLPEVATLVAGAGDSVLGAAVVDTSRLRSRGEPVPRAFALAALVPAGGGVELRLIAGPGALAPLLF